MNFDSTAWAINGALTDASIARRAQYASTAGQQGIIKKGDLAVSALSVPGQGIRIAPGVALVLNKYQNKVNEQYVISNQSIYTVPANEMPASSSSAKSYMAMAVVGDPAYPQIGHPFMPSTAIPDDQKSTYQYVRVAIVPCAAGAIEVAGSFPHIELARLDIPANTTAIQSSMITNLAKLAAPRQTQFMYASNYWNNTDNIAYIPSGSTLQPWSAWKPNVTVPEWANRCIVNVTINARIDSSDVNVYGQASVKLGNLAGPAVWFDYPVTGSKDGHRPIINVAGQFNVSSVQNQTLPVQLMGFEQTPAAPTNAQKLKLASGSQVVIDIRFFED